jgi:O-glycosyl hydrolase
MAKTPFLEPISRRTLLAGGVIAVPLALTLGASPVHASAAAAASFVVDPRTRHQVIRGFGGMTHASWIGDLTPAQRATAFGNGDADLGLSVLRIPVPEDRAKWSIDLETAKTATASGALVFASPWNPPAELVEEFYKDAVPTGSQYEAEVGTLTNAHIASDIPGFQSDGYAVFDAPAGAIVQFDRVTVGSKGVKNLAFRYCAETTVHVDIRVGDVLAGTAVEFPATAQGEWAWKSIQSPMTPGSWPVQVLSTGEAGPALDVLMAAPYRDPGKSRRLRYDAYDAYADHLNGFVHFLRDNGVELAGISVQNEPDYASEWTWWTTDEMLRFLRDHAGRIDAPVIAPESYQYIKSVSDPILQDPVALANVDIIGAHLYGTKYADFPYPLFQEKGAGKELWMTEVYYPNSSNSADLWPEALKVAEHVHHALADGGFQAYVWWYIRRFYGLIGEDGAITKRGHMISHFSKFVRPGYMRVEAPAQQQPGVLTSAYAGPNGDVVIVAVNGTETDVAFPVRMQGRRVVTVQSWVTDETRGMQKQTDAAGRGTQFTASLPPLSVTTFVV